MRAVLQFLLIVEGVSLIVIIFQEYPYLHILFAYFLESYQFLIYARPVYAITSYIFLLVVPNTTFFFYLDFTACQDYFTNFEPSQS